MNTPASERMRLAEAPDKKGPYVDMDEVQWVMSACSQLRADEAELARKDAEIAGLRERTDLEVAYQMNADFNRIRNQCETIITLQAELARLRAQK